MAMPNSQTMNQFRVTDPNNSEVIRQRLYDHLLYAGAGQQNLTFFAQMVGQGQTSVPSTAGGAAGLPKTYLDTNMDSAAQLPSGKQYLIETIEVYFYPGAVATANVFTPAYTSTITTAALTAASIAAVNDVQAFYESGLLEFNVLDKNFLRETPLRSFPPKTKFDLAATMSTAVGGTTLEIFMGHGYVDGRPYIMEPQISLQPASNFKVVLSWPAALALPSGFNARVGVYFDGYLQRAAQ